MALTSPGVQVSVVDESFYTPAEPGTVPMIFVTSAENKLNPAGTGIAPGTLKANAGKPYLLTSQRDLAETFGDPTFITDNSGAPIHGSELNEYGLQAAYSLLGVSNRAWVVRADVDTNQLIASADAPAGDPADETYWLDTSTTAWGIFEWNGNAATATGGQSFTAKTPRILTVDEVAGGEPKSTIGKAGDYAIVATNVNNDLFYKNSSGSWTKVGSTAWEESWPAVTGQPAYIGDGGSGFGAGGTLRVQGTTVNIGGTTITDLYNALNTAFATNSGTWATGLSVELVNNMVKIYATSEAKSNGTDVDGILYIQEEDSPTPNVTIEALGFVEGKYSAPRAQMSAHTSVPEFYATDSSPAPSGSIWVKTTEPNQGARFRVKKYNGATELWEDQSAPIHNSAAAALKALDSDGGLNIGAGALFVLANPDATDPVSVGYKIYRREALGAASAQSDPVAAQLSPATTYSFKVQESVPGSETLSTAITIQFTAAGDDTDADTIVNAISAAGLSYVVAETSADNRVVITHDKGGEVVFENVDAGGSASLSDSWFTKINFDDSVNNVYAEPADATGDFRLSLWKFLSYEASTDAPSTLTANGALWYSSVVDEADIMVHNGTTWVGYKNYYPNTRAEGPFVTASEPTGAVENDLWIDTSDLENYPLIYRFNALGKWELVDNGDQTTSAGIEFADARAGTSGGTANTAPSGTISELLTSNFLDFDAPDPALYPRGMLLFNTRRSGFNVKRFERNYIDTTADNGRQGDVSMTAYYPHRWVLESSNQENGAGSFGRKAQRKVVVQALQAMVNSNDEIRDDESRVFNMMATPGYPELIGEMISLNYDRGLTAFIVGDSPARLTPDATSLNEWGTNVNLAVEDNDQGLVSRDEYMGIYYPWGFTSDNAGNNVVVPPSHMMLRTIALSDGVSFPWFAPAGTRRGGITNASATGYIDAEGEFVSIALNEGQRDTLYAQNINPITFITGAGLVAFGQKTRARGASSLDRINVARLVVYLRRQLNQLAKPYIFEPNDKITRDEIKQQVESLLLELVGQRALYDFLVVCDTSNNTPNRIDRNELHIDIAIEPVKAVEFIYIPLRLKNTGEIAGL
jgi:hypothetical protein